MLTMPSINSEPRFTLEEFRNLVEAVSIPILVRSHEPLIEAFKGWSGEEFVEYLRRDGKNLREALNVLGPRVVSSGWIRLYGEESPEENDPQLSIEDNELIPDTVEPAIQGGDYPELREHLVAQLAAPFFGTKSITVEHQVPDIHGGEITVRSYWKATGPPDRPYSRVVTVDLDVTEERRTEQAAQEVADSRARIIRTVGHELRNPLAGIVGIAQVAYEQWDDLDHDTLYELIEAITDQAQDARTILEDLLAGAATEQSEFGIEPRPIDIAEILTRSDLSDFHFVISDQVPAMADPLRVRQIVRNLTQNARKYGGPNKSIRIFQSGEQIVIQVSDDGEGIQGFNLEHLFEPFNASDHEGSTGLGLSISKTLALAMGGDLILREDLPGTTFELNLPVSKISGGVGTGI